MGLGSLAAASRDGLPGVASGDAAESYHFSGPVVLEVHSHVNFAGLFTSAHFVFILSFPPGKEIKT